MSRGLPPYGVCELAALVVVLICVWAGAACTAFRRSLDIPCEVHADAPMPTWFEMYSKIFAATLIWGIGTALGEIPPYQFSYMAACVRRLGDTGPHDIEVI